ncbi:thiamine phosphate synthase [Labilibacter sediminis]|nr:thiamine phosphate synthase [Labilibacter sediminis]
MQYIIISNPEPLKNEIDIVHSLLNLTPAFFHLRKPDFSEDQMAAYLNNISHELHQRIVIHSHHQLCERYNLKGIHFTNRNKHHINDYLNYKGSKSISCHSTKEIEDLNQTFNYCFLSPIFQSVSKPGYGGDTYNMKQLEIFIKSNPGHNIVALGGISSSNIQQVKNMGFYGAAILGSFWQSISVHNKENDIRNFFKNLE